MLHYKALNLLWLLTTATASLPHSLTASSTAKYVQVVQGEVTYTCLSPQPLPHSHTPTHTQLQSHTPYTYTPYTYTHTYTHTTSPYTTDESSASAREIGESATHLKSDHTHTHAHTHLTDSSTTATTTATVTTSTSEEVTLYVHVTSLGDQGVNTSACASKEYPCTLRSALLHCAEMLAPRDTDTQPSNTTSCVITLPTPTGGIPSVILMDPQMGQVTVTSVLADPTRSMRGTLSVIGNGCVVTTTADISAPLGNSFKFLEVLFPIKNNKFHHI
jgi:hypothetical protein